MASALRTVLAATTLGAAVVFGAASSAGASALPTQGLGLPDLPTPDLGTPDLGGLQPPSTGLEGSAPSTSDMLSGGRLTPARTLPATDALTAPLTDDGLSRVLDRDGGVLPSAPGAADRLAEPVGRGFERGMAAAQPSMRGLDENVGAALPAAANPLTDLNLNPLSGGGFNPLDNGVGAQVADFKPVGTQDVTGELAHGASLKDLLRR